MKKSYKNKKGSITDMSFIIAGVFSVAIVALLVTYVVNNLNTQVQANTIFPADAKSASTDMADNFPKVMDGGIVFIFFGLCFISIVLASMIPVHPAFFIFYLLEYILLIWLGAGISNTYQMFIEHNIFVIESGQYLFATHFFQYFPFIIGVMGAVLAVVMYKVKNHMTGGYN